MGVLGCMDKTNLIKNKKIARQLSVDMMWQSFMVGTSTKEIDMMRYSIWNNEAYRQEGRKAAELGQNSWDNPYCFQWQTHAAYAWEEGFKAQASA